MVLGLAPLPYGVDRRGATECALALAPVGRLGGGKFLTTEVARVARPGSTAGVFWALEVLQRPGRVDCA